MSDVNPAPEPEGIFAKIVKPWRVAAGWVGDYPQVALAVIIVCVVMLVL